MGKEAHQLVVRILAAKSLPPRMTAIVSCGHTTYRTQTSQEATNLGWTVSFSVAQVEVERCYVEIALRNEADREQLGAACLCVGDIFKHGKIKSSTRSARLEKRWLPVISRGGQLLVSAIFAFRFGTSRETFEATVARICGDVFPEVDEHSTRRSERRLRTASKFAEKSLVDSQQSARKSLRDRIRDALAGLREKDRRIGAARCLWDELRTLEERDATVMMDEILGLRQSSTIGGIASAVLTDESSPMSAKRQAVTLLVALTTMHPRPCAGRLRAALRAVALASLSNSMLTKECARAAGSLSRNLFPHAAAAASIDANAAMELLIAPFSSMLSRPEARGRRAVAACVAEVLRASSRPCTIWLRSSSPKAMRAAPIEALRRHLASLGHMRITTLSRGRSAAIHCDSPEVAREIIETLHTSNADWTLDDVPTRQTKIPSDPCNKEMCMDQRAEARAFTFAVFLPASKICCHALY